MVPRGGARQRLGEIRRLVRPAAHEELDAAAIDDGVVGAAHGGEEVGRGRRQRRGADPVDDPLQREVERVRLVQRHLEHPGDDLHGAGEALGRRVDQGEAAAGRPVAPATFSTSRRRRLGRLQDQTARSGWSR